MFFVVVVTVGDDVEIIFIVEVEVDIQYVVFGIHVDVAMTVVAGDGVVLN